MQPLQALDPARFDIPAILKRLAKSSRALAELKNPADLNADVWKAYDQL